MAYSYELTDVSEIFTRSIKWGLIVLLLDGLIGIRLLLSIILRKRSYEYRYSPCYV